jgi:hypothetical protein
MRCCCRCCHWQQLLQQCLHRHFLSRHITIRTAASITARHVQPGILLLLLLLDTNCIAPTLQCRRVLGDVGACALHSTLLLCCCCTLEQLLLLV